MTGAEVEKLTAVGPTSWRFHRSFPVAASSDTMLFSGVATYSQFPYRPTPRLPIALRPCQT